MITGIHHIAIIASSNKSVDFYEKLGFIEIFRKERENDTIVLLEGFGVELEIFIDPSHPARSNPEPFGLRHIALQVDNIESVSNAIDCDPVQKDWLGRKYCNTKDPDGIIIEFHE